MDIMILINLNNQDKQLRYDMNAVCELEAKAGKGLFSLLNEENLGYNLIRLLVWAGLRHQNRGLTVDIVGIWLNDAFLNGMTFDSVFEKIMSSLKESGLLGKDEEEENKDDKQDKLVGEINPVAK
jgi:hypothetical protein